MKILASAVALAVLTSSVAYAQTNTPNTSQSQTKKEAAPIGPDGKPISTGGNGNSGGSQSGGNSNNSGGNSGGAGGSGAGGSGGSGSGGSGGGGSGGGSGN